MKNSIRNFVMLAATAMPFTATAADLTDARALVNLWLATDCDTDESRITKSDLYDRRQELEPIFLDVVNNGPNQDALARFEEAARQRAAARYELLDKGNKSGLSEEESQLLRRESPELQVKRERENFIMGQRSRALAGLAALRTPRGTETVRKFAQQGSTPLGRTAKQALKENL